MTRRARSIGLAALLLAVVLALPGAARANLARVGDLTLRSGEVPRRLVGYGLVMGLDGTGDRSFGGASSSTPTVRSVVNLLRRFKIEVPPDRLRLRNVAAVVVTAEVSPYLRAGGRFEVQVAALGDATSLRGGVLWITPLVTDPNQAPVATAQGAVYVSSQSNARSFFARRANSGRIAQGGLLEVDPPPVTADGRLLLRDPDIETANRIAGAVNAAFGDGTAKVDDPGSVTLTAGARAANLGAFLAAVDSLPVVTSDPSRIVIDGRDGTVVVGGVVRVGPAVVSQRGITLRVGGVPVPGDPRATGLVQFESQALVQDVAAGLHAAGARPEDVAAIFEALQASGALHAQVLVR